MFEKTTYLTERGREYKEYIIMRGVKPLALAVESVKKFCGLSTLGGTLWKPVSGAHGTYQNCVSGGNGGLSEKLYAVGTYPNSAV